MNILLVDVDSIIPNLALCQISAYHKAQGDQVKLINYTKQQLLERADSLDAYDYHADRAYISCIFTENGSVAVDISRQTNASEVIIGGSGVNFEWLPETMDTLKPDYHLYDGLICTKCGHKTIYCKCLRKPKPGNMFYSMGFTTRGCIRHCKFCIVRDKEGEFFKWQDIEEFHDPAHKIIILLDNNIFADPEWFFEQTDYIFKHKLKWNPIQGMDIRLLTPEIAKRLAELKWHGVMHFAFDNMQDEKAVVKGIGILKDAGIKIRHNVVFYVLVGYNTTPEEDMYRCRLLKTLGTSPFVMPYQKNEWTNKIARWANYKKAFWSSDIDEYDQIVARTLRKNKYGQIHPDQSTW